MNIAKGTVLKIKEPVYGGSFRNPKFLGEREYAAKVVKDSYGGKKGQHTFTLKVIESFGGVEPLEVGAIIRRKGRNLYCNTVEVLHEADEETLQEKNARGESIRRRKRHCARCGRVFIVASDESEEAECGEC